MNNPIRHLCHLVFRAVRLKMLPCTLDKIDPRVMRWFAKMAANHHTSDAMSGPANRGRMGGDR